MEEEFKERSAVERRDENEGIALPRSTGLGLTTLEGKDAEKPKSLEVGSKGRRGTTGER